MSTVCQDDVRSCYACILLVHSLVLPLECEARRPILVTRMTKSLNILHIFTEKTVTTKDVRNKYIIQRMYT